MSSPANLYQQYKYNRSIGMPFLHAVRDLKPDILSGRDALIHAFTGGTFFGGKFSQGSGMSMNISGGGFNMSKGPIAGIVAAFAGFGTVIGVIGAVLGTATIAAMAFVSEFKSMITGMATSGAKLGQATQFHNMAGALGISDSDLGSRARRFGELISGGGIPGSIAAQMGIHPFGGLGGDQNYFQKFSDAMKNIINDKDFNRASMKARFLGMEDMMWVRNADKSHQNMFFENQGYNMSPEAMTKAANAQIELNKAMQELMDTIRDIGRVVIPYVTATLKHLGMIIITTIAGWMIGGPWGALAGFGLGVAGASMLEGGKEHSKVVNANTQAVQANTDAVRENTIMVTGTYGGGGVFNSNIVPRGWGSMTLNDKARGMSMALGAFSI